MRAVSPIFPTKIYTIGYDVTYAKNQPQYIPLAVHKLPDGKVTSRWRLTWRERLAVMLHGNLWVEQLTFNKPLQPVRLSVFEPEPK